MVFPLYYRVLLGFMCCIIYGYGLSTLFIYFAQSQTLTRKNLISLFLCELMVNDFFEGYPYIQAYQASFFVQHIRLLVTLSFINPITGNTTLRDWFGMFCLTEAILYAMLYLDIFSTYSATSLYKTLFQILSLISGCILIFCFFLISRLVHIMHHHYWLLLDLQQLVF